jgi:dipeptidyl aminopeptidase/acylaminoacyl peptidase
MDYAKPGLASWDLKIDDVLAGVEALVARGIADPDRLGVTGGSFGGWGSRRGDQPVEALPRGGRP